MCFFCLEAPPVVEAFIFSSMAGSGKHHSIVSVSSLQSHLGMYPPCHLICWRGWCTASWDTSNVTETTAADARASPANGLVLSGGLDCNLTFGVASSGFPPLGCRICTPVQVAAGCLAHFLQGKALWALPNLWRGSPSAQVDLSTEPW